MMANIFILNILLPAMVCSILCAVAALPAERRSVIEILPGRYSGLEVRFGAVGSQSDVFKSQVVVHRVSQFLFASQIMLGRLNGHMAKQELNLFKFSPSQVA